MISLTALIASTSLLLFTCWIVAAVSDLRTMTIPNGISIVMIVTFSIFALLTGMPLATIANCLLAGLCTFAVCFALFAFNIMGGGDAKLLSASALCFGLNYNLIVFFVFVALFGGALTLIILLLRSNLPLTEIIKLWLPTSLTNGRQVPYGVAIAASGISNLGNTVFQQL